MKLQTRETTLKKKFQTIKNRMKLDASGQLVFCEAKRTGMPFSPNRK